MADHYNAFEISPVPVPGPDAEAPEVYRGVYGMPMFVTIPTADRGASVDFWTRGLGFVDLFSIPGRLTHLRRWAFQDVLLVSAEEVAEAAGSAASSVSFACVQSQVEEIARACAELSPGCTTGPCATPWNTLDLKVVTPEGTRVVMTAARPLDPDSAEARYLAASGITAP